MNRLKRWWHGGDNDKEEQRDAQIEEAIQRQKRETQKVLEAMEQYELVLKKSDNRS